MDRPDVLLEQRADGTGNWGEVPGLVEMRASGDTLLEKIAYTRFRRLANEHPELWQGLARLTAMNQVLAMIAANDLASAQGGSGWLQLCFAWVASAQSFKDRLK